MEKTYQGIHIRAAVIEDAGQLCLWWNDGSVMAHAGFPLGLGTTTEEIIELLKDTSDGVYRHIILYNEKPIGEMMYGDLGSHICEIGIKICDATMQNKGLGRKILSLFISELFDVLHFSKVILDTNLNNTRAQHVYESLGFQKLRVRKNCWQDQLGNPQSAVDYELSKDQFINYIDK